MLRSLFDYNKYKLVKVIVIKVSKKQTDCLSIMLFFQEKKRINSIYCDFVLLASISTIVS